MTRVASEKQYNSFVKGLITEASPLTFPENAFLDGDNIVLNKDGSFARRLGIDYETDYTLIPTGLTTEVLLGTQKSFHKWNFAGGDPNISLGVVRVRDSLYFLDMTANSPSSTLKNSGLSVVLPGLADAAIEVSVVNDNLVIVSSDLASPYYLEYNSATDIVTSSTISLKVRDFWGVDDGLVVDVRPSTLTDTHKYNLLNQGWPDAHITTVAYPSNADIWTLGKDTSDTFSKALLLKNSTDKAYAPKGKYILDMFTRGVSRATETSLTLPVDTDSGRISAVATYAGRVFYSGVSSQVTGGDIRSPGYGGYIFFSKTVSSKEDLGMCYQEADPTSETISDIIATDGGTINILEANKILRLVATKNSLVVFAENGVWAIYGSDVGFKATEFQLVKITNIGISNGKSVVVAGDTILYWAKNGIYMLASDQVSGGLQVQNVSLTTIQSFYDNLPYLAKSEAKGFYDQKENTVRWLYSDDSDDEYNKELVLDITLQAFYTNSISSTNVFLSDYVEIPNFVNNISQEDIYAGVEQVLVETDVVQVPSISTGNRDSVFSFLTFTKTGSFTLSRYSSSAFLDWVIAETPGIDYSSYIVTGYELFTDFMRSKQATYLFMMMERTETGFNIEDTYLVTENPSNCFVQAQWNWTDSAASGKWGNPFQAYRYTRPYNPSGAVDLYETGDRVLVTKNKLRGSGKALSLYIYSETGKDMKVYGFAIPVTGNSRA